MARTARMGSAPGFRKFPHPASVRVIGRHLMANWPILWQGQGNGDAAPVIWRCRRIQLKVLAVPCATKRDAAMPAFLVLVMGLLCVSGARAADKTVHDKD